MSEPIYARDLDGTGSMHICSKGDPGAVKYEADYKSTEIVRLINALAEKTDQLSRIREYVDLRRGKAVEREYKDLYEELEDVLIFIDSLEDES